MLFTEFLKLPKSEILKVKSGLNLTEDENIVFDMITRKKSAYEISDKLGVSLRTAFRRMNDVKEKFYIYDKFNN